MRVGESGPDSIFGISKSESEGCDEETAGSDGARTAATPSAMVGRSSSGRSESRPPMDCLQQRCNEEELTERASSGPPPFSDAPGGTGGRLIGEVYNTELTASRCSGFSNRFESGVRREGPFEFHLLK